MKSILVLDAQSFASDICNKEFKVKGLCFIVTFDHPSSFEFQNDIFFFTFIWFEIQSAGSFILCIMQDSLPLISSLNFIFYVHT